MKKIIIFSLFLLIGTVTFAQKADYCILFESFMQDDFPGTEVTYKDDCMIITYPLVLIANMSSSVSAQDLRKSLKDDGINLFAKSYINSLMESKKALNQFGFYYIRIIIKDDYRHNYRKYISDKFYIRRYYG